MMNTGYNTVEVLNAARKTLNLLLSDQAGA